MSTTVPATVPTSPVWAPPALRKPSSVHIREENVTPSVGGKESRVRLGGSTSASIFVASGYSPHETDTKGVTELTPEKRRVLYLSGSFGPYQKGIFNFLLLVSFVSSTHAMLTSFIAIEVNHWCAQPPGSPINSSDWLKLGIPLDPDGSRSKCEIFATDGTRVACDSWFYNETRSFSGIQSEWNLVCSRHWLLSFSRTVYFVGAMAAIFMGPVSDNIGRQRVIVINVIIVEIAGIALLATREIFMFLFCRFFMGFGLLSIYGCGATLGIEVTEPKERALLIVAFTSAWSVGAIALWLLTMYLESWLQVQLAIMIPTAFLLVTVRSVHDSARWYLALRDMDSARGLVVSAARMNRLDAEKIKKTWNAIMADVPKLEDLPNDEVISYGILKHEHMRTVLLVMSCCWTANSFIYYALSVGSLSEQRMDTHNTAEELAADIMEVPAAVVMLVVLARCDRLPTTRVFVLLEALIPWSIFLLNGIHRSTSGAVIVGRMVSTACFTNLVLYTLELYPTVMRTTGFITVTFLGRLGAIAASFTQQLGDVTFPKAPYMASTALCLVTSWLIPSLPETRLRELPDTCSEVSRMFMEKQGGTAIPVAATSPLQQTHVDQEEARAVEE